MHKHLQKINEHSFDKIFNQQLGFLLIKDYSNSVCDEPVPQLKFYEEVKKKILNRRKKKKKIFLKIFFFFLNFRLNVLKN
jgi:hypothetical protein